MEQESLIPTKKASPNIRIKLQHFFHSNLFHLLLGILISVDLFIVLLEIVLLLVYCDDIPHNIHNATKDLVYVSIGILGLFLVELCFQIYAFGPKEWCCHPLHVFDFIVVLVTFLGEILLLDHARAESLIGLLIVFRLWRLVRVIHVTAEALENRTEKEIYHLKEQIETLKKRVRELMESQHDKAGALSTDK